MDRAFSAPGPVDVPPQGPLSQNYGGQTHSQSPDLPVSSPADVGDNPRSPKRRRISPDHGSRDVKVETDTSDSKIPLIPKTTPPTQEGQAQDDQTKPVVKEQAQKIANLPSKGHAQDTANPSTVSQAQNVTAKPNQQTPLPQHNPTDHLSTLDQQASLILTFLSRLTPAEAMGLSTRPNAPSSREYAALRAAFDRTRRLVSPGWPFLPQQDLGLLDSLQIEIIRKANQAIFMSSIFTGEIGLRDMDRSFLAVFVPENGELSESQGAMYLDLKTQGFITAWRTGAAPPDLVMRDMFGPDLDKALLTRRPGTTALTTTEQEFLRSLNSRRSFLESAANTKTLDQLPLKYKWEDFSREVSAYLTSMNGPGSSLVQGSTASEPPIKEDYVALLQAAADYAIRSVLGLSPTDPIPPIPPSSSVSTPAVIPAVDSDASKPQQEVPDSNQSGPSEDSAPMEPPEQAAREEQSAAEGSTDATDAGPTSVLDERPELALSQASTSPGQNVHAEGARSESDGSGSKKMVVGDRHVE